eukprot:GDKK01052216.1.p1 GENE.GDKK01052216.1~~GDKK01052216.1.p1  ORF type:complete len:224 (-),score=46.47 GDKK01052216.1:231-902(-)
MSLLKYVAVSAAMAATAMAQVTTDQDKMKGIGLPIIFIAFFLIAIALNYKQLLNAWQSASGTSDVAWVFRASCLCALFSIFFYISSAWAYGLVSTILAYFLVCISTPQMMQLYGKHAAVIFSIWFLILLGIPSQLSTGLINATTNCQTFYGSYADKMCVDGWQTFLLIIATVQISLTFLCVLCILAASAGTSVVGNVQGEISRIKGDYQQSLTKNAQPAPTAA